MANAKGTPFIIPVPQSGPITIRSFLCAISFNSLSSSSDTLSLKINKLIFSSKSLLPSSYTYSPGIDINARFGSSNFLIAPVKDLTLLKLEDLVVDAISEIKSSNSFSTNDTISLSLASTDMQMSLGLASAKSSTYIPVFLKISMLAGVPIMIETLSKFSIPLNLELNNIRLTES